MKRPPKALREWMTDFEYEESEARAYILSNIKFFETSITDKHGRNQDDWIALKLNCKRPEAARAIKWAREGKAQ